MTKTYGRRRVLDDVDLVLETGSFHLLVGPNGAGKTTLLRLFATLTDPTAGKVRWSTPDGTELTDAVDVRARLGYAAHNALVYDDLSSQENLEAFLRIRGQSPKEAIAASERWLERFGLARRAADRVDVLSRGLRQRLALAQAFAPRPEFLLLDEPGSHLDEAGQATLVDVLREAKGPATVVVATHDADPFRPLADRVLEVRDAKVRPWGGSS